MTAPAPKRHGTGDGSRRPGGPYWGMDSKHPPAGGPEPPPQVAENIDAILEFYRREEESLSAPQRVL